MQPFMSPCGKERNFIKPADTPIVFDRIEARDELIKSPHDPGQDLVFGATLTAPLHPLGLYMSPHGGRMYLHMHGTRFRGVALARSQLALQVAEGVTLFGSTSEAEAALQEHGKRWQSMLQPSTHTEPNSGGASLRRRRTAVASSAFPHGVTAEKLADLAVGGRESPLLGLRYGGPKGEMLLSQADVDAAAELHAWPVWDVRVHPGQTMCREFWPEVEGPAER